MLQASGLIAWAIDYLTEQSYLFTASHLFLMGTRPIAIIDAPVTARFRYRLDVTSIGYALYR